MVHAPTNPVHYLARKYASKRRIRRHDNLELLSTAIPFLDTPAGAYQAFDQTITKLCSVLICVTSHVVGNASERLRNARLNTGLLFGATEGSTLSVHPPL